MNCLHKMKEHKTLALLYCERCPFTQWIGGEPPATRVESSSPSRPPKPSQRTQTQTQQEFPFGMPVTIGEGGRSMFESPTPEDDSIIDLERNFFGADAETQAALIEAFRKARNIPRADEQDPDAPATWTPGEEVPPGQPTFDAPTPDESR